MEKSSRTFKEWIIATTVLSVVQLSVFYASLVFYHFCVFRRKLARQIEEIRRQSKKLERITKGEMEPEVSPTQMSDLLDPDKTQKSDRVKKWKTNIRKSAEKITKRDKKEKKEKKEKKSKVALKPIALSAEKTQDGDQEPLSILVSHTDIPSQQENRVAQIVSDPELTQTASLFDEKPVYSPKAPQMPQAVLQQQQQQQPTDAEPEQDVHTARDDLWF